MIEDMEWEGIMKRIRTLEARVEYLEHKLMEVAYGEKLQTPILEEGSLSDPSIAQRWK